MNKSKRILLIDDDTELVEALARQARAWGLEVSTAHNTLTALCQVEQHRPDVICVDVQMPTGNGLSLAEMLADASPASRIPLIVLTGSNDQATRLRCERLGGHFVAKGNDVWPRLQTLLSDLLGFQRQDPSAPTNRAHAITERVFELLGAADPWLDCSYQGEETASTEDAASEPWVLCVEDDRDFSLALQLKFKRHGISMVRAFEGVEGIQVAHHRPANAIILDFNLPNGRGDYVLRQLKANSVTRAIPVIVVSGQKRPGLEKEMLHLGAVRFFAKPIRFKELLEELQRYLPITVSASAGSDPTW